MNGRVGEPDDLRRVRTILEIRHVVATFPPYLAGTGNVVAMYSRLQAKSGHHVTVLTPRYGGAVPKRECLDGVEVVRLPALLRLGNAALTPSLHRHLRGADIVHLHAPFYFGAELAYVSCKRDEHPLVLTYHNDVVLEGTVDRLVRLHARHVSMRIFRGADLLLVPSLTFGQRSLVAPLKWSVLSHGVDLDIFSPRVRVPDDLTTFAAGHRLLLFVGALDDAHYYKGLEDAFIAITKIPNTALAVIGDGHRRSHYERLAASMKAPVRFFGNRSHRELAGFYARADATLCPSRHLESFSLVVLESLACGTPVVATELVGGAHELLTPGTTGFLVAPRNPDAIAKAVLQATSASFLEQRRSRCVETAANHEWGRVAEKLQRYYEQVLA